MTLGKAYTRSLDQTDTFPAWQTALWGFALSALAGFVNIHAYTQFKSKTPVSHMSGAAMHMGEEMGQGRFGHPLLHVVFVFLAFFFGAVVSGAIIGKRVLVPGRRYGVVLVVEGVALLLAAALSQRGIEQAAIVSAAACGLQNAMAASYYGMVLRTTHVTGMVTDLGIMLGQALRGHPVPLWKAGILIALVAGFIVGGIAFGVGRRFTPWPTLDPLWLMGGALVVVGSGYYVRRVWLRRHLRVSTAAAVDLDE